MRQRSTTGRWPPGSWWTSWPSANSSSPAAAPRRPTLCDGYPSLARFQTARRRRRPCWRPPPKSYLMAATKSRPLARRGKEMPRPAARWSRIPSRLVAATLHLAAARRCGLLARPGLLLPARRPCSSSFRPACGAAIRRCEGHVLSGRGAVEFWSGDLDPAAVAFAGAAAAFPQTSFERAACDGHLALIEALRGRLSRAAELASAAINPPADPHDRRPAPSAAVALALVHLERNELDASRSRLKQADAALRTDPDRLISAVACLVAARGALARANGPAAADLIQRGRDSWAPPPWLDHLLTVAEAQASTATGDIQAALDAARRARNRIPPRRRRSAGACPPGCGKPPRSTTGSTRQRRREPRHRHRRGRRPARGIPDRRPHQLSQSRSRPGPPIARARPAPSRARTPPPPARPESGLDLACASPLP